MGDIVATSDRVYRLILNVYPRAFRDEYGEEMTQAMRDQVRDAWTERRVVGVTAFWLKVLLDTAASAFTEHLRQRGVVSFSRRGLGYGLATAFGFPLSLVTFASEHFQSAIVWAGETIGFQTYQASNQRLYPAIAGPGFVLAGIGLYGLYKRLGIDATPMIATVWVGAALGLYGTADIHYSGEFFGWYAVPAAFILLTFGLATMGRVALRDKTFGPFSFVPVAVIVSGGLWFLVLLMGTGEHREVMKTSSLLAHVALWFILGALLWADPPGNTHPVQTAEERKQIN